MNFCQKRLHRFLVKKDIEKQSQSDEMPQVTYNDESLTTRIGEKNIIQAQKKTKRFQRTSCENN